MRALRTSLALAALAALLPFARAARADAPAPYSLPWQLRPVTAATAIRADAAFASYEDTASRHGLTIAPTLLASYKIPGTGGPSEGLLVLARFASVHDSPPAGHGGLAIVNPLVGAAYALRLPEGFRANAFLGVTIPVGMGGGDAPDPGLADARAKGIYARSAMDNALFAVNDLALVPGAGFAYVAGGLTLQVEATLLQLTRVRGSQAQHEATKTNFTTGAHAGYFIAPALSLGVDLRYQRWLNAPLAVDGDTTGTLIDTWTVALGPRFHLRVGDALWVRPGIAYARGLDKPMAAASPSYHIVQIDVPIVF